MTKRELALWLTTPLRRIIRHELADQSRLDLMSRSGNIGLVLQQKATEEAADYVAEHMQGADSVGAYLDILTRAVNARTITPGLVLEFGVYSGSTINHVASMIDGQVFGFDSFEGLPERWRDGYDKGTFRMNGPPPVRNNVTLVKGWFDDTLPRFVQEHPGPLSLLHVDSDLYSSAKTIFRYTGDRLIPGSIIVFDEYFNYPGWRDGEFKAWQEFVAESGISYRYIFYNRTHEQVAVKITGCAA